MSSFDRKKRCLELNYSSIRDLDYESRYNHYKAEENDNSYNRRVDQLLRTLAPQYQNERTKFKISRSLETVYQWLKKNKKYLGPSNSAIYKDFADRHNLLEPIAADKSGKKLAEEEPQKSLRDKCCNTEVTYNMRNRDLLDERLRNHPRVLTGEKYKKLRRRFFNCDNINEQQMNLSKLYSLEEWIEFRHAIRSRFSSKTQSKELMNLEKRALGQIEYSSEEIRAILDSEPDYKKTVNEVLTCYLEELSEARARLELLKTLNSVSMTAANESKDRDAHGDRPSENNRNCLHLEKDATKKK